MATLIFDIATVGTDWENLDVVTKHNLTKYRTEAEASELLGLSPLTGSIVALGVHDLERRETVVYGVGGCDIPGYHQVTEQELLQEFWAGVLSYDVFVTFGGRRFDIPFIHHRSLVHDVRPTKEFPRVRHVEKQHAPYHIDLHDELSFRGELRAPVTLHLLAQAYGMESPDGGEVTGETVGEFFRQEKFADLARYTEANVTTTARLYEKWLRHLAPTSFLNLTW